jgi:hypothetical protein
LRTTLIQLAWLWLRHQPQSVITHPHFHRAFRGRACDFRVPLATDSDL